MNIVFAQWRIPVDDFEAFDSDEIYISCGAGDEQYDGYFINDEGATINVKQTDGVVNVEFSAPSDGLETHSNLWLSPSTINDFEAVEFGIKWVD